ncbi:MAG: Smr/MutS family protein [Erysipelotrichia bacterium]|jgi:DNA-nicking Smr family endonuclease|nr:Smr/MutS family protein [Erysipelotrichia bacterium]
MIATLDLHHCTKVEAKKLLDHTLDNLGKETTELVIIHGYQGGHVIKDLVLSYRHHRIERVIKSINPGQTSYLIKAKK